MRIRWTTPARRDSRAHIGYLAVRNEEAAFALGEAIHAAIERLTEFPYRGRPGRRDGTRELAISGWPYAVVYSVDETRVIILRILHTSQSWPPQ
jgi:toxin ParE1/3/4